MVFYLLFRLLYVLGPEYGTTEAACYGLFVESDRLGALHSRIRDKLVNEVLSNVKSWQKENYSKQKLGGLKQQKELDDGFVKVGLQHINVDKC